MDITLRCKICGKIISGCYNCRDKVLHWKNIACSEAHFQEYMKKVEDGRNKERT